MRNEIEPLVAGFFIAGDPKYRKYHSPENQLEIVERVLSFGFAPSITAIKRAILELVNEGVIGRTDGLTDDDDVRIDEEKAEARKQQDLAAKRAARIPTNAKEYRALSSLEVMSRYRREPEFKAAVQGLIAEGVI